MLVGATYTNSVYDCIDDRLIAFQLMLIVFSFLRLCFVYYAHARTHRHSKTVGHVRVCTYVHMHVCMSLGTSS